MTKIVVNIDDLTKDNKHPHQRYFDDEKLMREDRLKWEDYRIDDGPDYILRLYEPVVNVYISNRDAIPAELFMVNTVDGVEYHTLVFQESSFGPSPMHSIDGDGSVYAVLNFWSMKYGDTDDEYFENYTDGQKLWVEEHAEDFANMVYFWAEARGVEG